MAFWTTSAHAQGRHLACRGWNRWPLHTLSTPDSIQAWKRLGCCGYALTRLLRGTLGGTTLNQTGRELESILLMMLIYLLLSLIISAGMNVFNSRVKLKER